MSTGSLLRCTPSLSSLNAGCKVRREHSATAYFFAHKECESQESNDLEAAYFKRIRP